jgi:UDP-N-acetylmuramoyl-L-alanyl-D-glutamate--2,6-diaminopimelate ligase
MTLERIISIIEPSFVSGTNCFPTGKITDDSRQVQKGDIFVAVRGNAFDGHKFVNQAIEQGAAVVVSEELIDSKTACVLVVENTRAVLGPLALDFAGNPQNELQIVGVTGTNGKTTVATLIWQVLEQLQVDAALVGTVSKRFGKLEEASLLTTPGAMELANDLRKAVESDCRYFIMEVSSHALEQLRTNGLSFKVAIFTNLTHDHLDYHGTMDAYASAKKLLFDGLSDEAIAIVNVDDEYGTRMLENTAAEAWDLSLNNEDFRVMVTDSEGILIDMDGIFIQSPLTGRFNAYNVAQAYLAAVALGFSPKNVASALAHCRGAAGRLENVTLQLEANKHLVLPYVFVDYAHTPNALENVLQTLAEVRTPDQKIYTVFGCGGDRDRTKRPEMAEIAEKYSDICVVTSDNPRFEDPDAIINEVITGFSKDFVYQREPDRRKAIESVISSTPENAIILIAGKGHETYQEIKGTRHPMDDREIALNALRERILTSKPEKN